MEMVQCLEHLILICDLDLWSKSSSLGSLNALNLVVLWYKVPKYEVCGGIASEIWPILEDKFYVIPSSSLKHQNLVWGTSGGRGLEPSLCLVNMSKRSISKALILDNL